MFAKPTVTIINNEPTFRWTISRLLEAHGYAVSAHERDAAAVDLVRETRPEVVVLEAAYGSAVSATTIIERLRGHHETRCVPIIVCSPDGRFLNSYGEYLRDQGCIVTGRPFSDEQFIELIQSAATIRTPLHDVVFPEASHFA